MSVVVYFGSALRERTVATSWRTLSLSSPASVASLSSETIAASCSGSNAGLPSRRWTFARWPARYSVMTVVERGGRRGASASAQAICGLSLASDSLSALSERGLRGVAAGRAVLEERGGGGAAHAVVGATRGP